MCVCDCSDSVVSCIANIHSYVLADCRQTRWVGDTSDEVTLTQFKQHEKKRDIVKSTTHTLPNRPYTKNIMLENIKQRHRDDTHKGKSELYVGPTIFYRFMETFRRIYNEKAQLRTEEVLMLK